MRRGWKQHNLKLIRFEQAIRPRQCKVVAGVDEAGRGPLAGPVVASAVVLKSFSFDAKIFDCKRLTLSARQEAFIEINSKADVGIGIVGRRKIDEKNILQATITAVNKALNNLEITPEYLLIDGCFKADSFAYPGRTLIKGDTLCFSIACASIVAKVTRDSLMDYYSGLYPQYGFQRNRGYGTQEHIRAINKHGLSPIHRLSFGPCVKMKSRRGRCE